VKSSDAGVNLLSITPRPNSIIIYGMFAAVNFGGARLIARAALNTRQCSRSDGAARQSFQSRPKTVA
jgi:hypothetical protein